jgi:hypothetical protein
MPLRGADRTSKLKGADALTMIRYLTDPARNPGQLFDKPAARLGPVCHTAQQERDRVLAEVLDST